MAALTYKMLVCRSEKAQGMVEYALIIAFVVGIAAYFLVSSGSLGSAVNSSFDAAQSQIERSDSAGQE